MKASTYPSSKNAAKNGTAFEITLAFLAGASLGFAKKHYTRSTVQLLPVIFLALFLFLAGKSMAGNAAAGFFWKDNTLPYDTSFSYCFDVAVYPDGGFLDDQNHNYAYITAENKHICYNGVPYGVEAVVAYFRNNNNGGVLALASYDDPTRFTNAWIDNDADVSQGWRLSTLQAEGYLTLGTNGIGEVQNFLRIQEQTVFVSESTNPVQSTWQNKYYLFNFSSQKWDQKMQDTFIVPASRAAVRTLTYQHGCGEWAGMLETSGKTNDIDQGTPPMKDVCYKNRSVSVVDQGRTLTMAIDFSVNDWLPAEEPYNLLYASQSNYDQFVVGWDPSNPLIVTNPASTLVAPGGSTTLNVSAVGTTPFTYQWFANGSAIQGATNPTYTTPKLTTADSGSTYQAVVSGSYYSMTSAVATVSVAESAVTGWGLTNDGNLNFPSDLTNAVAVSAGPDFALALTKSNTVIGWGNGGFGQTNIPAGLTNVAQISAGYYHALALKQDGTVAGWGTDYYGICDSPTGLSGVIAVAAGGAHSLALKNDGTVIGWGDTKPSDGSPAIVPNGLSKVVSVAAGQLHSLALKSDGTVVAWGNNSSGQASVPRGLSHVVAISAGNCFSLALKSNGTVVAWGDDTYGECHVPVGLTNVVAISAGSAWSALALKSDGTTVSWGMPGMLTLSPPPNLGFVTSISAGGYFALAIQSTHPTPLALSQMPQLKKVQTITVTTFPLKSSGWTSYRLNAKASSGLPVSLSVISGPATIQKNILTRTGFGTVVVAASQPGNDIYGPANGVIKTFP